MSTFWPSDLELNDIQSPMDILEEALREWESRSNGMMTLVLQSAESTHGDEMIIVHAKHLPSNRTAALFSVVYRPSNPYPATIQPRDDELPKYLRKTYRAPGRLPEVVSTTIGHTVTNEWVSETPLEFRVNLRKVFNLSVVKSEVLNLAREVPASETDHEDEAAPHEPPDTAGE